MNIMLGITPTGWRAFRQQRMFTVHFLRENPGRSLCRVQVPYRQKFTVLPPNAVLCERCRRSHEA